MRAAAVPGLRIRAALPADGDLIAALIQEHTADEQVPAAARGTGADYASGLAEQACECLIAELDGEPVGLAMFYATFSSWQGRRGLFLEDLFVRDRARGLGLGRRLVVELARLARARGCTRLDLVVQAGNRARRFYGQLGLREVDG